MAADATTIARPYAEAVFKRADESGKLDPWSETLALISAVVADPAMTPVIGNPLVDRQALTELLLEIVGERVDEEGANLIRLLVRNGRLGVAPEIATLFEDLKAEKQRVLGVHVKSAFAFNAAQEKLIADALKAKLGVDVTVTSEKDADLIGGLHIRAGDLVIDGTVRGKLQLLANELGI